jgi:hypothetical protein
MQRERIYKKRLKDASEEQAKRRGAFTEYAIPAVRQ